MTLTIARGPRSPRVLAKCRVVKTLQPHCAGAKRHARRFGEDLVCVRHRMSDDGLTRHTTVELLVESLPVQTREREIIAVRPPSLTQAQRAKLIENGATWHPRKRYWLLPRLVARLMGLVRYRLPL